ncbi:C40 family peptidase [Corynebacterium sp. H113]|uniref:C40 family peptidase n=1 Tax=Corynebacterium sp. H113 TaxID=3133419 RepID=UPI00309DC0E1
MLDVVSRVPEELAQWVPAELAQVLDSMNSSTVPTAVASPDEWSQLADLVTQSWTDGYGDHAASSLMSTAESAAELFDRNSTIDGAIADGQAAISSAVCDLAGIAERFLCEVGASVAGVSTDGATAASPSMLNHVIAALASGAMAEADARMRLLESELATCSETLEATSDDPVMVPDPPQEAASEAPAQEHASATPAPALELEVAPEELSTPVSEATPAAAAEASPVSHADSTAETAEDSAEADGHPDSDITDIAGAPTPEAAAAVQHALSAVGTPYQWGGNQPGVGLDCSGLTHWAYGEAGVEIPRTAAEQAIGRQVQADELLPGDLVVWEGHVAMVIGDGQMVEAGDPVQTNPIRTENVGMEFYGFYRPTG